MPLTDPRYSLGIDIGGTFTDVAVWDHVAGRRLSRKVLTTHGDPAQAVVEGVQAMLEGFALDPAAFRRVVHATTLFTNALIERRGARTGLLTTRGFRDVVEIGRERKYALYDLTIRKPEPLAPRELRAEVDERLGADGRVLRPLDEAGLLAAASTLVGAGAQSLAVCFLHAYLNPVHERRALALLGEAYPALALTASHEVAPEIREFERTSTALANAYVKPLAARYLDALAAGLRGLGIDAELSLMQSSGGLTHLAEARRVPVQMLESGPAAGALAAAHFGSADAGGRVLAFDMGGTTAKLSLVDDGEPLIAYGFEAARQQRFIEHSGLPVRISTIELIEIGAGGGSIAAPDRLGLVKVGPRSAGSEPGPAAYGRGGTDATVTDADLLLGYLSPQGFAGGTLRVDTGACRRALARTAEGAGMSPEALAWGIHDIVNENMASAARVHFAERGRDPATTSPASCASRASSAPPRPGWPRPWGCWWRRRGSTASPASAFASTTTHPWTSSAPSRRWRPRPARCSPTAAWTRARPGCDAWWTGASWARATTSPSRCPRGPTTVTTATRCARACARPSRAPTGTSTPARRGRCRWSS
jgi:N-methylhydantoinase A